MQQIPIQENLNPGKIKFSKFSGKIVFTSKNVSIVSG
jgi:hypothetical protein